MRCMRLHAPQRLKIKLSYNVTSDATKERDDQEHTTFAKITPDKSGKRRVNNQHSHTPLLRKQQKSEAAHVQNLHTHGNITLHYNGITTDVCERGEDQRRNLTTPHYN
jgi:hypothetical protein